MCGKVLLVLLATHCSPKRERCTTAAVCRATSAVACQMSADINQLIQLIQLWNHDCYTHMHASIYVMQVKENLVLLTVVMGYQTPFLPEDGYLIPT